MKRRICSYRKDLIASGEASGVASGSGEPSFPDPSVRTVALSEVAAGVSTFAAVKDGEVCSVPDALAVAAATGDADVDVAAGACVPGWLETAPEPDTSVGERGDGEPC